MEKNAREERHAHGELEEARIMRARKETREGGDTRERRGMNKKAREVRERQGRCVWDKTRERNDERGGKIYPFVRASPTFSLFILR